MASKVVEVKLTEVDAVKELIAELTARAERAEAALRLIAGDGCSTFTRMSCRDQYSGRYPVAKYGADRWCDQCIAQAGLDGDSRLAALDSTDPEPAPEVDKITTTDLTVAAALTNATAIPVDFDPAPEWFLDDKDRAAVDVGTYPDVPAPGRSGEECICGTPGTGDFDGPLRDCPVHGDPPAPTRPTDVYCFCPDCIRVRLRDVGAAPRRRERDRAGAEAKQHVGHI